MTWEVCKVEFHTKPMDELLREGWEPFAVTRETISEEHWDDYRNRTVTDVNTEDMIWLRRRSAE